ncbi:MAG TPA: antitermination protein NusG [Candidatus Olsenella pullistercoris]|uniref:Antitermination protein NusG n=1 Tax=Candidatus Olsenella pullistercoris TaxID=2838712 RepID=A0A9D2JE99_9ACTN|nr:antitermination protein NusG [Candidatus Olsenella pullistercoris]
MADTRELSMMPFALSAPQNAAGGGVSAETSHPDVSQLAHTLLTKELAAGTAPYLVLSCAAGRERSACERALATGLATEAFSPLRVTLFREGGIWVARTAALWPGYVLSAPAHPRAAEKLGAIGSLTPLESALVRRLGGSSHVIQISQGRIEDGRLRVLFGPLMGLEPLVRRIDRHRRMAWLEAEPGRSVSVGLEVTSKT